MSDLRIFCANFRSEKVRLCYFLRFLHVCFQLHGNVHLWNCPLVSELHVLGVYAPIGIAPVGGKGSAPPHPSHSQSVNKLFLKSQTLKLVHSKMSFCSGAPLHSHVAFKVDCDEAHTWLFNIFKYASPASIPSNTKILNTS